MKYVGLRKSKQAPIDYLMYLYYIIGDVEKKVPEEVPLQLYMFDL